MQAGRFRGNLLSFFTYFEHFVVKNLQIKLCFSLKNGAENALSRDIMVWLKSLVAGVTVFLTGLFGCTKSTPPAAASTAPAVSNIKDLGVVTMTNQYETSLSFGPGKNCRIVPQVLDRNNLQLTITIESKGTNGQTAGLSVVRMTGSKSKPFDLNVGGKDYTFTPVIAAN